MRVDSNMNSSNSDEIPYPPIGTYLGEAPECVGTCFYKARRPGVTSKEQQHQEQPVVAVDQTPDAICHEVRAYCESEAMRDFCQEHGVENTSFTWNANIKLSHNNKTTTTTGRRRFHLPHLPHTRRQSQLSKQFWNAYDHDSSSRNLALGFHGTADANVSTILKHGLDPKYRRTQAFGKGEYFSKEPGLSATYGNGGHCLVVYLLIMPNAHEYLAEKKFSQKDRDIIVLTDASHQLPIGVIRFEGVDADKIDHSQQMRLVQRSLKTDALQKDWLVQESKLGTTLMELLQNGRFEEARAAWKRATMYHDLSGHCQQRIATLVHQSIPNAEQRQQLFPSIQAPTATGSPTKSLEVLEDDATQAWTSFWAMKMDPHRNLMTAEVSLSPSKSSQSQSLSSKQQQKFGNDVMIQSRPGAIMTTLRVMEQ